MAISEFQANELVTRNNVNSRISGINAMFPVSVANGGTGGTTKAGAVSSLGVTNTNELAFSGNSKSDFLAAVRTHFENNNTKYVPYVFNARWENNGFGVAAGIKTTDDLAQFLFLFHENLGLKFYLKNNYNDYSWIDCSFDGMVLYDNSSGTANTVELAESSANFRELLILYINNNNYYESKTLIDADGQTVVLSTSWIRKSNSTFYQKAVQVRLDGKYIYYDANNKGQFRATATQNYIDDLGSDGIIKICKVIGYNRCSR